MNLIKIAKSGKKVSPKYFYYSGLEQLFYFTCSVFDINIDLIMSKERSQYLVRARYCFFYLAKKHTNEPLYKIGELVNRDHVTVLHGLKEVNNKYNKVLHNQKIYIENEATRYFG